MPANKLEQRVAVLEERVAELSTALASRSPEKKDWQRAVEKFSGNEGILEIIRDGMKIREADRKRARRKRKTPIKSKQ